MKNTKKKWLNGKKIQKLAAVLAMVMFCLTGILHQNVTYAAGDLEKITASYKGDKVEKGYPIDKDDIAVKAYYSDGSNITLDSSDFTITPDTMKSSVSQVVKISYTEGTITKSTSVTVYCEKLSLDSITATYIGNYQVVGGKISSSDIKVVATYEDGSRETVYDWWLENYTINSGSNRIRVYYKEDGITQQDSIYVSGIKADLSRIEVSYSGLPVGIDGHISPEDIRVTAYYKDSSKSWGQEIASRTVDGWVMEPYSIQEGTNTITISYNENGQGVMGRGTVLGMRNIATWQYKDGKWKYRRANQEYVVSSWIQYRENWYYMDENGEMATGWVEVDDNWYYLGGDGRCRMNTTTPDGHTVDENGARIS